MANRRIKQLRCEQAVNSAIARTGTSRIADLAARGSDKHAVDNGRTWVHQGGVSLNADSGIETGD